MPEKVDLEVVRQLLEIASKEMDPDKVLELIVRINERYDVKGGSESSAATESNITKSA